MTPASLRAIVTGLSNFVSPAGSAPMITSLVPGAESQRHSGIDDLLAARNPVTASISALIFRSESPGRAAFIAIDSAGREHGAVFVANAIAESQDELSKLASTVVSEAQNTRLWYGGARRAVDSALQIASRLPGRMWVGLWTAGVIFYWW